MFFLKIRKQFKKGKELKPKIVEQPSSPKPKLFTSKQPSTFRRDQSSSPQSRESTLIEFRGVSNDGPPLAAGDYITISNNGRRCVAKIEEVSEAQHDQGTLEDKDLEKEATPNAMQIETTPRPWILTRNFISHVDSPSLQSGVTSNALGLQESRISLNGPDLENNVTPNGSNLGNEASRGSSDSHDNSYGTDFRRRKGIIPRHADNPNLYSQQSKELPQLPREPESLEDLSAVRSVAHRAAQQPPPREHGLMGGESEGQRSCDAFLENEPCRPPSRLSFRASRERASRELDTQTTQSFVSGFDRNLSLLGDSSQGLPPNRPVPRNQARHGLYGKLLSPTDRPPALIPKPTRPKLTPLVLDGAAKHAKINNSRRSHFKSPAKFETHKDFDWPVYRKVPVDKRSVWTNGGFLGEGGFGSVFYVKNVEFGGEYAMKCIDLQGHDSLDGQRAITGEVGALDKLKEHPSLFTVGMPRDRNLRSTVWISSENYLHILTDFCPGGSLAQHCGKLGPYQLRRVLAELVLGLEHVHSLGIIHKDLKPGNVLITAKGHCAISDYGTAEIVKGKNRAVCQQTLSGTTPWFSAPELSVPNAFFDKSADIFSLASMFIALAWHCRFPHFYDDNTNEIIRQERLTLNSEDGKLADLVLAMRATEETYRLTLDQVKESSYFLGVDWESSRDGCYPPFDTAPAYLQPTRSQGFKYRPIRPLLPEQLHALRDHKIGREDTFMPGRDF